MIAIDRAPGYIYRIKNIWDNTKPRAIVIIFKPEEEMSNGVHAMCKKLKPQLSEKGFGGYNLCFLFPSVKGEEACSKYSLLRTLHFFEEACREERTTTAICAWGSKGENQYMFIPFLHLASRWRKDITCFGITEEGTPKEPTYLSIHKPLLPYEPIK